MAPAVEQVTLPHGYWRDGVHCRGACVRALTGADQEALAEAGDGLLPVECATLALARCVTRLDGAETVSPALVEGLTVGDREALLLHLRRATLGERVQCNVRCPAPGCGAVMDLDLQVSDLLLEPYAQPQPSYVLPEDAPAGGGTRFRLPTGADQTAAARGARGATEAGVGVLLDCCLASHAGREGAADGGATAALTDAVAAAMEAADPQAQLLLSMQCPECGQAFDTVLDAGAFLMEEVAAGLGDLYREVHLLARHYHWSESEILAMTPAKRRIYLGLLMDDGEVSWA